MGQANELCMLRYHLCHTCTTTFLPQMRKLDEFDAAKISGVSLRVRTTRGDEKNDEIEKWLDGLPAASEGPADLNEHQDLRAHLL